MWSTYSASVEPHQTHGPLSSIHCALRLAMNAQLWTVDEVAAFAGIGTASADTELRRHGVKPIARQPGRGGKNLYEADVVKAALASRTRGVRRRGDGGPG